MLYACVRVGIASIYILYNEGDRETVSKYWEMSSNNSISGFFFSSFGLRLLIQGGTLLLLIPGVIYSMRYMFTLPIYVLEKDINPGFRKSLAKSRAITNGYKSSIFCKTSIMSLLIIVSIIILGLISFLLFTMSIALGILMSIITGIALFIGMGIMACIGPVIVTAKQILGF